MKRTLEGNPYCFFRYQGCNRLFEATQTCFIASPTSSQVQNELNIIKKKLEEKGIYPYIAVEEREYQKDIPCEKVCSKIFESQFCIVILNDVPDPTEEHTVPNPNVYWEYGLMTALRKKIILIVRHGHKLAFNTRVLDTMEYTLENLETELAAGIEKILTSLDLRKKLSKMKIALRIFLTNILRAWD